MLPSGINPTLGCNQLTGCTAKDYYIPNYGGSTGSTFDTVAISYVITTYTAVDGGGTATAQSAVTRTGLYAYSEFREGVNQEIDPDDAELTNTGNTSKVYLPDNTAGFVYAMDSGTPTKYTVSTTARVCSAKYTPIKMRFINKFGMPQDFYFFLKSVESVNTKSETFKRNIFNYSSSNYDVKSHQTQTFNKNGRKRLTLNTDYLIEGYNLVIEDIMLSEYVWIISGNIVRPVTVVTSSLTKKTSLNDKLIQYTLEVEEANEDLE